MTTQCVFIVPVYNEEGSISNVIKTIYDLEKNGVKINRTIVIDDGSTDRTPEILKELKIKHQSIEIITHNGNLGIEKVFETGLNEVGRITCDEDIVIMLEGDNTNEPEAIPRMIEEIKRGNDIVVASRFRKNGGFKGFPFHRKMISLFGNLLLRWAFRVDKITDYTVFFRAYRAKVIKRLLEKYGDRIFETTGFTANTELLVKLATITQRVTEVPHFYNYTRKVNYSKFRIMRTAIDQIRYIVLSLIKK